METEPLRTRTDKSRLASQSAAFTERFRRSVEAGAQMGKTVATRAATAAGCGEYTISTLADAQSRAGKQCTLIVRMSASSATVACFLPKKRHIPTNCVHTAIVRSNVCPFSDRLHIELTEHTYVPTIPVIEATEAGDRIGAALRSRGETSCNHPSATRRYPAFSIIRAR